MTKRICLGLSVCAALLMAGCQRKERPETTAYRKAVETLQVENRQLQQQMDVSTRMLNITSVVLVINGCALGVSLFVLRRTRRC